MDPKDFSFVDSCWKAWETVGEIRSSAIKKQKLIRNEKASGLIHPTLQNIRFNYKLLKGFTQHMAAVGVIMTKRLEFLKPPIEKYYRQMEVDTSTEAMTTTIHGVGILVKKMLSVIKRKWSRWEMPRVPRQKTS
jgi:hypothetical protein